MGYICCFLKLKIVWDIVKFSYRLNCLTECDIFSVRSSKFKKLMKNLLNKLVNSRKKTVRVNRNFDRRIISFQIEKMGKMGQQLVVASR